MKQFACDIEDRIPEPWSPVVRTCHAVDATEVAAIGHRDAQVVQRPAARVERRRGIDDGRERGLAQERRACRGARSGANVGKRNDADHVRKLEMKATENGTGDAGNGAGTVADAPSIPNPRSPILAFQHPLSPEDRARAEFYAVLARLFADAPDAALLRAIAGAERMQSGTHLMAFSAVWMR